MVFCGQSNILLEMKTPPIGILGSGTVAKVLAKGFLKHNYPVMLGTRQPVKLAAWSAETGISVSTFDETARFGEVLVLAVKGSIATAVLDMAGQENLAGKVVIDPTNPIAEAPPDNGVIRFFTGPNESLMERLQAHAAEARFVKAFNSIGNALMVNPTLPEGRPTMFICGNDAEAKATVTGILDAFGHDAEDMGGVEGARAIEPLCILWCIPGFLRGEWGNAFRFMKPKCGQFRLHQRH